MGLCLELLVGGINSINLEDGAMLELLVGGINSINLEDGAMLEFSSLGGGINKLLTLRLIEFGFLDPYL